MTESGYSIVPLSPIRKIIAARMVEAKQTIPHFRLSAEIEVDALIALRGALTAADGLGISLNALIIKACAAALIDVPAVNLQWAGDAIHQYRTADISIVTALPGGGLSTPILRDAQAKSVQDIASEVKVLTKRAGDNALKMDEVFGGSFSISNLGMFGVEAFDAIINPPQCAILAIASTRRRLLPSEAGEVRAAMVLPVTLSVDHRAIDGAAGASFLNALRKRIEEPAHIAAAEVLA